MTRELRRVAVIGGVRIPFCRSNTLYADLSNLEMMTAALNGLVDRFGLKGQHIDEVVGGAVVTHSRDFNLAREAVLSSKLAPSTPGVTLIQACGTSLQSALMSAGKIASGEIECAISVGSDTTSDAPIVFSKKFSKRLVQVGQSKTALAREQALVVLTVARADLAKHNLDPQANSILSWVDGRRTVRDIATACRLTPWEVLQILDELRAESIVVLGGELDS